MNRKYLFRLLIFLFLAAASFGIGVLVAQRKIKAEKIIAPSKVAVKLPQKEKETAAENIPENISQANSQLENSNEENIFSFAVIGDTQSFNPGNPNGGLQKAVKNISEKNADLIMTEGDLLSGCDGEGKCEANLASWKNVMEALYPKTYELMGNHDRTGREKSDALWQRFFNLPTNGPAGYAELVYSFDYKNSHFVVLNSEKPEEDVISDVQRNWLEEDLNKNKKDNIFAFFHEPAYPVSSKIGESLDAKPKERDALWNILSSHNVTAVFNGHEHIASRRKIGNLYQFIFGNTDSFNHDAPKPGLAECSYVGQSFGIVGVNGKEIAVDTYSVDGKLLNSFKINR
jgi:hypothetical protein